MLRYAAGRARAWMAPCWAATSESTSLIFPHRSVPVHHLPSLLSATLALLCLTRLARAELHTASVPSWFGLAPGAILLACVSSYLLSAILPAYISLRLYSSTDVQLSRYHDSISSTSLLIAHSQSLRIARCSHSYNSPLHYSLSLALVMILWVPTMLLSVSQEPVKLWIFEYLHTSRTAGFCRISYVISYGKHQS